MPAQLKISVGCRGNWKDVEQNTVVVCLSVSVVYRNALLILSFEYLSEASKYSRFLFTLNFGCYLDVNLDLVTFNY